MTQPDDTHDLSGDAAKSDAESASVQLPEVPIGLGLNRYAAFISYANEDAKSAQWLQRVLEGYRVPKSLGTYNIAGKVNRIAPVFRDRDELAAGQLGKMIQVALRSSSSMVVVCSPHAIASEWVEREIRLFRKIGRGDRIFAIILSGEPNAVDPALECLPPSLRAPAPAGGDTGVPLDLLAGDLRPGGDGSRNACLKVIAGILGVNLGRVLDRDRQRRRRRWRISASAFAFCLAGLAAGYVVYENTTMRSAMLAQARLLTTDGRPIQAAKFAVAGVSSDLLGRWSAENDDQALMDTGFGFRLRMAVLDDRGADSHFLTRDGNRLLTRSEQGNGAIWNTSTGAKLADLGAIATTWYVSEDGTRAAIRSHGDLASLWDLEVGKKIADLGELGGARGIYYNAKNGIIVTVADTSRCALWDIGSGAKITDFPEISNCTGVSINDDPALITIRSAPRQGAIFGKDGQLLFSMPDACDYCGITQQGDYADAIDGPRARIYQLATRRGVGVLKLKHPIQQWVFSKDGRRAVARDSLNSLTLVDTERAAPVANLGVAQQANWTFLQGGKHVLVWNDDNSGTLWDTGSGRVLQRFSAGALDSYLSSPDGKWFVTISEKRRAELWDLTAWHKVRTLPDPGTAMAAEISPDSTRLIISSDTKPGYIWDLQRGAIAGEFESDGADDGEGSRFSGNSAFYLTATFDNGASLWDARRAVRLGQLGGSGAVGSQSVSYDGSTVVTTSPDKTVAVWDTTISAGTARGRALRQHACVINHDAIGRFGIEITGGGQRALSSIAARIRGRPWNPCDWRGLLSTEGWLQFIRLWAVRLGVARDYSCTETDALGHVTDASRANCRVPEVSQTAANPSAD